MLRKTLIFKFQAKKIIRYNRRKYKFTTCKKQLNKISIATTSTKEFPAKIALTMCVKSKQPKTHGSCAINVAICMLA